MRRPHAARGGPDRHLPIHVTCGAEAVQIRVEHLDLVRCRSVIDDEHVPGGLGPILGLLECRGLDPADFTICDVIGDLPPPDLPVASAFDDTLGLASLSDVLPERRNPAPTAPPRLVSELLTQVLGRTDPQGFVAKPPAVDARPLGQ
jgi:hypothetical protein